MIRFGKCYFGKENITARDDFPRAAIYPASIYCGLSGHSQRFVFTEDLSHSPFLFTRLSVYLQSFLQVQDVDRVL